jgi:4-diphosphocytidyl-2-C-methyl-D-erythritol kinase
MSKIDSLTISAPAKINLSLDILKKRADGYHEIETVMQSVSLCDTVTVQKAKTLSLECSDVSLNGKDNLGYRAAVCFFEHCKLNCGCKISIEKRIPKAAGLGGGSTDAAAVLRGLNSLYETKLSEAELCKIALTLGADVPFCVVGRTSLCKGVGEKLTLLKSLSDCFIVIVKAASKISTAQLYSMFDKNGASKRPNTKALEDALEIGDLTAVCRNFCNVFQDSVECFSEIKHKTIELGAEGAGLSGSGPSVFAVFRNMEEAKRCTQYFNGCSYICKPI